MSQENIEIVRRGYEAFNRGDREVMVADVAPAFEYESITAVPGFPERFGGPEGWQQAVSWLWDAFDGARVEIHELVESEEKVLASVSLHARGKQSGVETSWHVWNLWTIEGGKIVRGQGFRTGEEAREVAGLLE